jgi:hypothetical protein
MTFQQFWNRLQQGGTSPQGDQFSVTLDDRLHIESPGNKNNRFFITKETVRRWVEEDLRKMETREFRRRRSAYFHNVFLHVTGVRGKPTIYLADNHVRNVALTLKEDCHTRWNNAWICRAHGSVNFKKPGAKGTSRFLVGDILCQGVDVTMLPEWKRSRQGETCCHSGTGYLGRLCFGSEAKALKFLKQFFKVLICPSPPETKQSK